MLTRVWVILIALTAIEVVFVIPHLSPVAFLTLLLVLSVGKSVLILAYFMHLKFERRTLSLALFPLLITFILVLLLGVLPDAAYGQCSQCFRTAAAQQQASRDAMNSGILALLAPVVTLFAGFCYLAWRRRDS